MAGRNRADKMEQDKPTLEHFGRPELIEDADKKRWRPEMNTPSSQELWSNMYVFDDDERKLVQRVADGFNRHQSNPWKMRIVENK